jgi:DNA-binding transcriptional regulator YhcF (GntR family)
MADFDERGNGAEAPIPYERAQGRFDYLRYEELQDRYDRDTFQVLTELLFGLVRRATCSGMGIFPFIDQQIAERTKINLEDVRAALDELQSDGLIYWHKVSHFILVNEYWRHNWIENPSVAKHIEKVVRKLPQKCGFDSFKKIEKLFEELSSIPSNPKSAIYSPIVTEAKAKVALAMAGKITEYTCVGHMYPTQKEVGSRKKDLKGSLSGAIKSSPKIGRVEVETETRFSPEERESALRAVEYFRSKFQSLWRVTHPPINGNSNLERMCHVIEILADCTDSGTGYDNTLKVIDTYFDKDYGAGCDYSFWHFTTDRVWGYLAVKLGLLYEEMYFDTDGQPNESIEY